MKKQINNFEKILHKVWKEQAFEGKLQTKTGDEIEVFSPGEENLNRSGPDFLNAKIRIGSLVFIGDVEIDVNYTGWQQHGHNIDGHYVKTILHVIFENKRNHTYVYTRDGRKIPILQIDKYISKDYLNAVENQELNNNIEKKILLKCEENVLTTNYFTREKFVAELGRKRFQDKTEKMFHRLKELKFLDDNRIDEPKINFALSEEYENLSLDKIELNKKELWEQLFYEFLFEALGYTQNKHSMLKLARLANLQFIRKIGYDEFYIEKLEALLFGISGLLTNFVETDDEEMNKFLKKEIELWEEIKLLYDSDFMEETDWHFFRMRPQNFPTVRIAAGSVFINRIIRQNFLSKIAELFRSKISNKEIISQLRNLFILKSFSVWKNHYVFFKKSKNEVRYLVGLTRADEIIVNVVLPFLALYFTAFNLNSSLKKVQIIFGLYEQKSEYKIVNEIAPILGLNNLTHRTIFIQGLLNLYRSYCTKYKCKECKIGQELFQ